jgi:hypothetical protein
MSMNNGNYRSMRWVTLGLLKGRVRTSLEGFRGKGLPPSLATSLKCWNQYLDIAMNQLKFL